MEKFNIITNVFDVAAVREMTFESRPHLVAPVVLLVEGVHNGILYEHAELERYPNAWSGIPLPIHHPRENGEPISANDPIIIEEQSVGNLFNVKYEANNTRLVGEIWVDINKANSIAPEVLGALRGGQRLEVSTGLYFDVDPQTGTWNGEQYEAIARNYRPDHLALLPGGVGACSWSDGCGVRSNEKEPKPMAKTDKLKKRARLFIMEMLSLNEPSHDELRAKLQQAIDTLDNDSWIHFLREVYDDFIVYEARGNNPSEGIAGTSKLYKRNYSLGDDEAVTLAEEVIEVREERNYVPVGNDVDASPEPGKQQKETVTMTQTNDAAVQALIACEHTRFTEADAEWLNTLSAEQLEKMKAVDEPCDDLPAANDVPPEDTPAANDVPPEDTPVTLESYIDAAPPEVADVLRRSVARDAAEKAAVIDALVANDRCKFTKEQLEAKQLEELTALAELANVSLDFSGAGGAPPAANDDEIPDMPKVFEKKTA